MLLGLTLDDPQPLLDKLTGELVDTWKESFGSRIGGGGGNNDTEGNFLARKHV